MIPLARPLLGDEELAALAPVLASGWLVQGPRVAAFEQLVADRVGVAHAVACSSGTAALHLALLALELPPGSRVALPSYTFPATANAVLLAGHEPLLLDVRPDTFNLDPSAVREALDADAPPAALLPVHQFGQPAELGEVLRLCAERGLPVIEDAACALGATALLDGVDRGAGSLGTLGCFSFHPRKIITTGEGGVVTTDDPELADRLRSLRNHGMRRDEDGVRFERTGLNYRLSELHAALGVVQMGRLDDILADRRRIAAGYLARIEALHPLGLLPPTVAEGVTPTWQTFAVRLPAGASLGGTIEGLRERGVQASVGAHAVHRQPAFARCAGCHGALAGADACHEGVLALPVPFGLGDAELDQVVAALGEALEAQR